MLVAASGGQPGGRVPQAAALSSLVQRRGPPDPVALAEAAKVAAEEAARLAEEAQQLLTSLGILDNPGAAFPQHMPPPPPP